MDNAYIQLHPEVGELLDSLPWKHRVRHVERSSHRNVEHTKGSPFIHHLTQKQF